MRTPSITYWIVRCPLLFVCSYTPLGTQHYKHARNFFALLLKMRAKSKGNHNPRPSNQSYTEKWGGHYTSFVAMHTTLQTNNSVRNFSAMNPGHFRKCERKAMEAISCYCESTPFVSAKRTGTQGRTKVNPWYVLVLYGLQLAKRD